MATIKIPKVRWALGDPEQFTHSGVTLVTRPLYHDVDGKGRMVRVGAINPDFAEALMTVLDTDQ